MPPHPGPLAAISNLHADLGLTLLYGLIIAVPTVIVAGPLFGMWIARRIPIRGRDVEGPGSWDEGRADPVTGSHAHATTLATGPERGSERRPPSPSPC